MAAVLPDIPKVETHILVLTNEVRREAKLGQVAPSAVLAKAARAYAEYLARTGQFSHTADGKEPAKRAEAAGYRYCEIGENLALHQDSRGFEARDLASKAMTGWINSPGHRANIMAPHVTEIGIGVAKASDADPKYIAVQLFGRPESAKYEFQIVNSSGTGLSYSFGAKTHDIAPHLSITHHACRPDSIVFQKPGTWLSGATEIAKVTAEDGKLYTLKADASGKVVLEVGKRQKVK
jgi:hypothetical protein